MYSFKAKIDIIGINPFVLVPNKILKRIFKQAGKEKGAIPIRGTLNGKAYKQTLVKYKGNWRLYINTTMLENSPKRIGERVEITIEYDPADRRIDPHPKLVKALTDNPEANKNICPASRIKTKRNCTLYFIPENGGKCRQKCETGYTLSIG